MSQETKPFVATTTKPQFNLSLYGIDMSDIDDNSPTSAAAAAAEETAPAVLAKAVEEAPAKAAEAPAAAAAAAAKPVLATVAPVAAAAAPAAPAASASASASASAGSNPPAAKKAATATPVKKEKEKKKKTEDEGEGEGASEDSRSGRTVVNIVDDDKTDSDNDDKPDEKKKPVAAAPEPPKPAPKPKKKKPSDDGEEDEKAGRALRFRREAHLHLTKVATRVLHDEVTAVAVDVSEIQKESKFFPKKTAVYLIREEPCLRFSDLQYGMPNDDNVTYALMLDVKFIANTKKTEAARKEPYSAEEIRERMSIKYAEEDDCPVLVSPKAAFAANWYIPASIFFSRMTTDAVHTGFGAGKNKIVGTCAFGTSPTAYSGFSTAVSKKMGPLKVFFGRLFHMTIRSRELFVLTKLRDSEALRYKDVTEALSGEIVMLLQDMRDEKPKKPAAAAADKSDNDEDEDTPLAKKKDEAKPKKRAREPKSDDDNDEEKPKKPAAKKPRANGADKSSTPAAKPKPKPSEEDDADGDTDMKAAVDDDDGDKPKSKPKVKAKSKSVGSDDDDAEDWAKKLAEAEKSKTAAKSITPASKPKGRLIKPSESMDTDD